MSTNTMPNTKLVKLALDVLTLNEVGADEGLPYRFSDPDGIKTGKSGYSYGRVQFDTKNNKTAIDCLRACGFTQEDIDRLLDQSGPIDDLDAKLLAASDVVDRFDKHHTRESVEHCEDLLEESGIQISGIETFLHIVDYHNQLYMSKNGPLHRHLQSLKGHDIIPEDIGGFKLNHTKWGRDRPDDVARRFENIEEFCKTNDAFKIEEA